MSAEPNYDESKVGPYTLPPLLVDAAAAPITTPERWRAHRPWLLGLYADHVYGRTPEIAGETKIELVSVRHDALGGRATRKIVRLTHEGLPRWKGVELLVFVPNQTRPAPVFVGLNFRGNHAAVPDEDIAPRGRSERGSEAHRMPVEQIVGRGYAVVTACYNDFEHDSQDGWRDGVRGAYDGEATWGAIGAWAWGLSRMADYVEADADLDATRLAVFGHSRLGKTSLWAGAQDERFGLVISNNSGEGGAALMRRNFGETTADLVKTFPHWFTPAYANYVDRPHDCPVDQHQLLALVAPRGLYVASATEDLWADPLGEFLATREAARLWPLFARPALDADEPPAPDQSVGHAVGYHLRSGPHELLPADWAHFLSFADRTWRHARAPQDGR